MILNTNQKNPTTIKSKSMEELKLIKIAIDRLKSADESLMGYNTNWSTDEKYKRILNLISTAYQCLMELEKIKASHQNVSGWVSYPETRPEKYGRYFVHRKDGKTHWETWNTSGFAYNDKVITHWMEVNPPKTDPNNNQKAQSE